MAYLVWQLLQSLTYVLHYTHTLFDLTIYIYCRAMHRSLVGSGRVRSVQAPPTGSTSHPGRFLSAEEEELQLALALSQQMAEEEEKERRQRQLEDEEFEKVLRLSLTEK